MRNFCMICFVRLIRQVLMRFMRIMLKRVIRALEFFHQNGTPISAHNEEQKKQTSPYDLAYFVLNAPRDILYERID